MNDDSIMPFGVHKGKKMGNVPAFYLLWILGEWETSPPNSKAAMDVKKYIEENKGVLEMEKMKGIE